MYLISSEALLNEFALINPNSLHAACAEKRLKLSKQIVPFVPLKYICSNPSLTPLVPPIRNTSPFDKDTKNRRKSKY